MKESQVAVAGGGGHYGRWQAANKMTKNNKFASNGPIKLKIGQRCRFPPEITHKKCQLTSFKAYRIGSRMIIYLTDEDSDGMKSQFFHPSDNHLSTWCFTDQRLYEAFYNYLCRALFIQLIVRRIKNIIVHLMIFFIICVLGEGGGHHYKIYIFFFTRWNIFTTAL